MKKLLIIILTMALLTSAMFSTLGVSSQYLVSPMPYFQRVVNVFENYPETVIYSYNDAWATSTPEYETLSYSYPAWQKVDVDSAWEVVDAVTTFMNNCITYVRSFFVQTAGLFPKLWNNLKATFVHWFTPITVTFENIASVLETFFTADDWFICLGLAFIPADWQQMVDDGVDVDIPLFGDVSARPLTHYFGEGDGWRGGR